MRSVFVLACLFAAVLCAKTVTVSLTIHDDDSYKFEHGHVSGATAWAHYEESYEEIGWQKLHLRTNHKDSDEQQARAAGMLEAHLTHGDIVTFYRNAVESNPVMFDNSCPALQKYIEDSYNHLTAEALSQGDTNPEWGMVMLYLEQLNSMGTQYRRDMVAGEPSISDLDFYRMNMAGEGDDLVPYLCPNNAPQNADEEDARYGHCTGAVRVAPGNAELFIGQDTWSSYSSMNRILKRYSFGYQRATVGDVSFSSYPATLFSMDDFYTTGAKLAILETTFVIFAAQRAELYTHDNMNPLATVPTWMRAMVANTLAQNGEEWTAIFAKYNSGTYNNQWLVVDYKLFTPGKALESNTVWMLEQLPGHIHRMDNTPLLRSNKWIPSVNAPSYAPFHKLAGYDDQTPYWQYHGPRYHIFSERMGNVKTMADFKVGFSPLLFLHRDSCAITTTSTTLTRTATPDRPSRRVTTSGLTTSRGIPPSALAGSIPRSQTASSSP